MIVKHPLWNQEFEQQPDGLVRVTDLDSGQAGLFTGFGIPVSGELVWADPQLVQWVGGRPRKGEPEVQAPVPNEPGIT